MALRPPREGPVQASHGQRSVLGSLRGLSRLPREQALGRLSYAVKQPIFGLPIYRYTLNGRGPTSLLVTPSDPWPGNAEVGAAIVHGSFVLLGQELKTPAPLWQPVGASKLWCEALNGFSWLRDLRASGGDAARRTARELVLLWLEANERWDPLTWDPVVTGQRLAHWLGQYEFFAASAEVDFRHSLLHAMSCQARHLSRVLPAGITGAPAVTALKGLIYAGACLPGAEACAIRGLELLCQELPRQLAADGGHIERSPARHMEVLRDLIDIRATLASGNLSIPQDLQTAIEQMTPMLRLFLHGDGGLAQFNGSSEAEGWKIEMLLQRAVGRSRPLLSAPQSGFQRLQSGRTVVIVDAGQPPSAIHDTHTHAGPLSFELSVGRERLIVNCGAQPGDGDWALVQRATAAHSTLVMCDTNSCELKPTGGLGRRRASVTCRRDEAEGHVWLDLAHDGYVPNFGLTHHRRLYLAKGGDDLRGEDRIEGSGDGTFAIRFHLHPRVSASLVNSGDTALLRLTKGGGWRFHAKGAELRLEPSVYLGATGEIRRSQQIVLLGLIDSGKTTVKWALRREAKTPNKR